MIKVIILINLLILVFFTHWTVNGVYDGLRYGMSKHHDFFNYGFIEYSTHISLSILLPLLNILINLNQIKSKFLLCLTILKNFSIFIFCLSMMLVGIYDELSENKPEWSKTFYKLDYEIIVTISFLGIILPLICMYLIYTKHLKVYD